MSASLVQGIGAPWKKAVVHSTWICKVERCRPPEVEGRLAMDLTEVELPQSMDHGCGGLERRARHPVDRRQPGRRRWEGRPSDGSEEESRQRWGELGIRDGYYGRESATPSMSNSNWYTAFSSSNIAGASSLRSSRRT
uniref:Uncharacterized protein n=1 Tax=Oryza punctata TaxID=4537 RepID=A0A0E0LGH9_ORYPU